jgi:hypothetical protein
MLCHEEMALAMKEKSHKVDLLISLPFLFGCSGGDALPTSEERISSCCLTHHHNVHVEVAFKRLNLESRCKNERGHWPVDLMLPSRIGDRLVLEPWATFLAEVPPLLAVLLDASPRLGQEL